MKVNYTHSGQLVQHGKASSYNNHRCRCAECRRAWATYMAPRIKKYRQDKKKKVESVRIRI